VGTATDAYQPIEGHYRITRRCLEVLADSRTPFSVVTKGPMVLRDADVLAHAMSRSGCKVFMSVPTVDEDGWTRLEPGTAPPSQRLRALRQLKDAGIETGVFMMPLVPGVTTSAGSINRTVAAIADAGLSLAGSGVARFDPGVREHFLGFLGRSLPALVSGYRRLYVDRHAPAGYANAVKAAVHAAARRAGLRPRAGAASFDQARPSKA
jgi:DNA repair photolyase